MAAAAAAAPAPAPQGSPGLRRRGTQRPPESSRQRRARRRRADMRTFERLLRAAQSAAVHHSRVSPLVEVVRLFLQLHGHHRGCTPPEAAPREGSQERGAEERPSACEPAARERDAPGAGAQHGAAGQAAAGRRELHGVESAATGTAVKMLAITAPEGGCLRYAHIGAMDCYRDKSFEELRMEDYLAFRVHGCELAAFAGGGLGPRSGELPSAPRRTGPAAAEGAAAPTGDLLAQAADAPRPLAGGPRELPPPRRQARAGRAPSGSEGPRRRVRHKRPPS
mmetsp:Transcript_109002/g.338543  ORF Transcript_109002/g.338543 Transcript_109002/m.338543 type:complete len:280 (+) Transcript_109002:3-842(+)